MRMINLYDGFRPKCGVYYKFFNMIMMCDYDDNVPIIEDQYDA